jgi:aminocarboxymuconate-semialdehyde decarboxylase
MTVIDVHTHMLSHEYLDLLLKYGAPDYRRTVNRAGEAAIERRGTPFFTLTDAMLNYELRIQDMDAAGVDLGIVSLTCPNVYFGNAEVSLNAARCINDSMAAAQTSCPDRIRWLASLPWQYSELAVAELERAVQGGAVGVMVIATIDGACLTDDRFAGIWAAIERLNLPVLVHPGPPRDAGGDGVADFGLVPALGFPSDTTVAFSRMFLSGFLDRYPRLRLIAAHGGGTLPWIVGRLDRCHQAIPAAREQTETPPSEYLRRIWFDAVVYSEGALDLTIEAAGSSERVLYGSDYPHNIGDMTGCLARVDALPGSSATKVRGRNALALFNL